MVKFVRSCTRYENGKCRLHGYNCTVKRERGIPAIITMGMEIACYWFTRDPVEGQRVLEKLQ